MKITELNTIIENIVSDEIRKTIIAESEGIKKEVSLSIFSNFIWCQIGFRLVRLNFYDFIFFYCGQASVGCDGQDEGDPETRGDDSER